MTRDAANHIHPGHFLASIGVTVRVCVNCTIYTIDRPGNRDCFVIRDDADWSALHAIINDAEYRYTGKVTY